MTNQARLRRIGWIAILAVCAALYLGLHLKVQSVKSEVVHSERRIVQLEEQNVLLETEFLSRSNQLQLAKWNRVDFGYIAPEASQFITGERQLAMLGDRPALIPNPADPARENSAIQLANYDPSVEGDAFGPDRTRKPDNARPVRHEIVSSLTGRRIDPALVAMADNEPRTTAQLAMVLPHGSTRIQLGALAQASVP